MTRIQEASEFAALAHRGQLRKYTDEPYINHPRRVAKMVFEVSTDDDLVVAALLHDVVEDTETTIEQVQAKFGLRVGWMVESLTERKVDGENRAARKLRQARRLYHVGRDVQTIKLADLIDNTSDIVKRDPKFARVYLAEKMLLLGALQRGNIALYDRAYKQVVDAYAIA